MLLKEMISTSLESRKQCRHYSNQSSADRKVRLNWWIFHKEVASSQIFSSRQSTQMYSCVLWEEPVPCHRYQTQRRIKSQISIWVLHLINTLQTKISISTNTGSKRDSFAYWLFKNRQASHHACHIAVLSFLPYWSNLTIATQSTHMLATLISPRNLIEMESFCSLFDLPDQNLQVNCSLGVQQRAHTYWIWGAVI